MNRKKNIKGFTLVELIVVLVILAILAAFTIPAMLGFVEDARSKKSITMTREVYTAAQSAAAEIYAQLGNVNVSGNSNPNITLIKEKVGTKIKEMTAGDLDFKWVLQEKARTLRQIESKILLKSTFVIKKEVLIIRVSLSIPTAQKFGLTDQAVIRQIMSSKPSGMLTNLEIIERLF